MMPHILIAPNAFKNSLTARAAAIAIEQGLQQSRLQLTSTCFPIGDGGDGTGELIIHQLGGERINCMVKDPLGRDIEVPFGLIDDGNTAIIEMADASGLRLLKREELNPMIATSYGTGQLMKAALDQNVNRIVICMGGSATVDGGCGILQALGAKFLDNDGKELNYLPDDLIRLASVDLSKFDHRIHNCEVSILCDVDNRLLGENGASAVFGPQKGASEEDVIRLDGCLQQLAAVVQRQSGVDMASMPYGGTAGGAAAGLSAFLSAELVNGIDHFLTLTGFDEALLKADLLITGEGSIDEQTLQGKGPAGVAYRAKAKDIPVIGLAGKVPIASSAKMQQCFDVLLAIGNGPMEVREAMAITTDNLIRTARELGNLLAISYQNKS